MLTNVAPLRRKKVSDMVVEAIENLIISNGLKEGDKLPSEKDLARTLAVGTRLIREALKVLEARGLVDVLPGKGTYIAGRSKEDFARSFADSLRLTLTLDKDLLLELMYMRLIIETSVVVDVAQKRSDEDLGRLSETLDSLEKAYKENQVDEYNHFDVQFHKQIIDIVNNRILTELYEKLNNLLILSFNKTGYMDGSMEESVRQHKSIFEAIKSRDESTARTLMIKHLTMSVERLRVTAFEPPHQA